MENEILASFSYLNPLLQYNLTVKFNFIEIYNELRDWKIKPLTSRTGLNVLYMWVLKSIVAATRDSGQTDMLNIEDWLGEWNPRGRDDSTMTLWEGVDLTCLHSAGLTQWGWVTNQTRVFVRMRSVCNDCRNVCRSSLLYIVRIQTRTHTHILINTKSCYWQSFLQLA